MSTAAAEQQPLPNSVRQFFKGKHVLCTGCTGFVGKVLVEKLLRCTPDIGRIYLLVRPKKELKNIQERVSREILESPIMDRLKKEMGKDNFYNFAKNKIYAVPGDVENPQLLTCPPDELEMLKRNVTVIIHSAATIGFHEPLNHAIRLNTFGVQNTLAFAKQCQKIESLCHVSTAYVNCNQSSGSFIEEKQFPLVLPKNEDVDVFCKRVAALQDPNEVKKISKKMLKYFKYPNTYTFTKRMAEHLLIRNMGNIPITILRPTIIGSAAREPWPGWVDAATAAGSIYLAGGVGTLYVVPGDRNNITDHVPVDYVVNGIILSCATVGIESARMGKALVRTFHCGTSYRNPVAWGFALDNVNRYWQSHRPKRGLFLPDLQMIYSPFELQVRKLAEYTVVRQFYQTLASIVRKKDIMNQAAILQKRENRAILLDITYRYFFVNEWFYDSTQMESCYHRLVDEEKAIFYLDFKSIDWSTYFQFYCWGLQKYVLKEDAKLPTNVDVTRTNAVDWFADITFSFAATSAFNNKRSRDQLKQIVLQSAAVQIEIQNEASKQAISSTVVQERALEIMDLMFADPKPTVVRFLAWALRKIWRIMYQSITVDDQEIDRVRALAQNKSNGPLIIIPTHRSYIDFLILSYIFFAYDLPVPHIAAGEDFLNMFMVRNLFRHSGAFFLRRQFGDDSLYVAIFSAYVKQLLADGCPLEFFVEGTRSRAGKTLQPKLGLLSIISDAYLEKNVKNLTILPIHISYEKILEGESYTSELLGDKKKPETLQNLIKARTVLRKRHGDINVRFAKPISLAEYSAQVTQHKRSITSKGTFDPQTNSDDKREFVKHLGFKIAHDLDKTSICMPTALISAIILAHREGIAFDQLVDKYVWLKELIMARGGTVHHTSKMGVTETAVVVHAVALLQNCILYHKDMVEPNIGKNLERNYVHLNLYRNQLVHLFVMEAIISVALRALGGGIVADSFINNGNTTINRSKETGIDKNTLQGEALKLWEWLRYEFFTLIDPDTSMSGDDQLIGKTIDKMVQEGQLQQVKQNRLVMPESAEYTHDFLCSLMWPFVESYWLACMSLFSIQLTSVDKKNRATIKENTLQQRMQWLGEKLYHQNKMHFFESLSGETLKNAIQTLVNRQVLQRMRKSIVNPITGVTGVENHVELKENYSDTNAMLKLVDSIAQFRRINVGTVHDYPIVSKL